jgi:hypothetical protein
MAIPLRQILASGAPVRSGTSQQNSLKAITLYIITLTVLSCFAENGKGAGVPARLFPPLGVAGREWYHPAMPPLDRKNAKG